MTQHQRLLAQVAYLPLLLTSEEMRTVGVDTLAKVYRESVIIALNANNSSFEVLLHGTTHFRCYDFSQALVAAVDVMASTNHIPGSKRLALSVQSSLGLHDCTHLTAVAQAAVDFAKDSD